MVNITKTAQDAYTWRVTYHDSSTLDEYDETRPDGRGFAEIDSAQVRMVELSDILKIAVPDGAEPVFFRRRRVVLNPEDDTVVNRSVVHCIGWKKDDDACYLFVFADGSTLLSSDLQAV